MPVSGFSNEHSRLKITLGDIGREDDVPLLTEDLEQALDRISGQLFTEPGRGPATKSVHDAVEKLAPLYAQRIGVAFERDLLLPAVRENSPDKSLVVYRERHPAVFRSTQGILMHDHSWYIFYNNNAAQRIFSRTGAELAGYMLRCELAMEVEWDFAENVPMEQNNQFHKDFRKLLIAKAPFKVFVFRSQTPQLWPQTISDLETQLYCYEGSGSIENWLISAWCDGKFSHHPFER